MTRKLPSDTELKMLILFTFLFVVVTTLQIINEVKGGG